MKHYVYLIEGEPYVGNVQQIGTALRNAEYGGPDVQGIWEWIPADALTLSAPHWRRRDWLVTSTVADDWRSCLLTIEDNFEDEARFKIDLRA